MMLVDIVVAYVVDDLFILSLLYLTFIFVLLPIQFDKMHELPNILNKVTTLILAF